MRPMLEEQARGLPVGFAGYIPDTEYVKLPERVRLRGNSEPERTVRARPPRSVERREGVVASDVGGLGENIDAFVNGLKCDASPAAFAWGISTMVDEPWMPGLWDTGQKESRPVFRWEPIAQKMAGTYARVVA